MKSSKLSVALKILRRFLKAAIDHCDSLRETSDDLQAAILQYSLSCLSLEKVIDTVERSSKLQRTAAQDEIFLRSHLSAARDSFNQIKTVSCQARIVQLCPLPSGRNSLCGDLSKFLVSKLGRIAIAINSAVLLVSIRLNDTNCHGLSEKLHSLIIANVKSSEVSAEIVALQAQPTNFCCTGKENTNLASRLKQLLKPNNVAFIREELQQAYSFAALLSYDKSLPTQAGQLLSVDLLRWLLEKAPAHPAHVTPKLVSYRSEIIKAAQLGEEVQLAHILRLDPDLRYSFTIANLTPIFFAIYSGRLAAVRCLHEHGVSVNAAFGRIGTVPLAAALQFRNIHIARYLINEGANLQYRNASNWSLLFFIWFKSQRESPASDILTLLYAHPEFESWHKDVYDQYGWHLMHWVVANGATDDIARLIDYGVDPFVVTKVEEHGRSDDQPHEYSVLELAILYHRTDVVKLLLPLYKQRYHNVDLPNPENWTLLHIAVKQQNLEVISVLLEEGANSRAVTNPTLVGILEDGNTRRYTPYSLAKEAGSDFYAQFCNIANAKTHGLSETRLAQIKKDMQDHRPTTKNSHKDCRKIFGSTTLSGHASAHQGDYVSNVQIQNLFLGSPHSLITWKRRRRKALRRMKR